MNDFSGAEEFDGGNDIRVINQAQNVVVSGSSLLFWGDLVSTTYTKI